MKTSVVRPSSLDGIKRLAKSIKRERNVIHAEALDAAARAAGYQNLKDAQRTLAGSPVEQSGHDLYLSAYWTSEAGSGGRETLRVRTVYPWAQMLKPQELYRARGLRGFRIDAADHLELIRDVDDKDSARHKVCAAARAIAFMEATGLRPATANISKFDRAVSSLPGRDHTSFWIDPATRVLVLSDEPYPYGERFDMDRQSWAERSGMTIAPVAWPGMYVPGSSLLYLVSDARSIDLLPLVRRLDVLPPPIVSDDWTGASGPYATAFVTPLRNASGRVKRNRSLPVEVGVCRRGAVAYGHFPLGIQWRPDARMPLAAHEETGVWLKALCKSSRFTARVQRRVNHVRSELDEWVQREYTRVEIPDQKLRDLYYGDALQTRKTEEVMIERVTETITQHYPDCVPLRDLLRALKTARESLLR